MLTLFQKKACQRTGWNENNHKADCKLLKDDDLKGLFSLHWDKFEHHLKFPLKTSGIETPEVMRLG